MFAAVLVVLILGLWSASADAQEAQPPYPHVVIKVGTIVRMHGGGCIPGADVRITIGASHASGEVLATFPSDSRGRFNYLLPVPFHGEPNATLIAECDEGTPTGITTTRAYILEITYIYPIEIPATGSGHTATLAVLGTGLVAFGAGLLVIGRRASR
jgi:hypothetical protein